MKLFVSRFGSLYHKEVQYVTKLLNYSERILSKSPPGRLTVRRRSGRYYYSMILRDQKTGTISEKYMKLRDPLLRPYVEKYCAGKMKPVLQKCIRYLRTNPRKYDTDEITMLFKKFESYFGDLLPAPFTTNEKLIAKWSQEPFEGNPFHPEEENLYQTRNGEMVRSKDECICANMLSDFRLIYKYEAPLKLKSGRTVYPDFDIPSPVNCTAWQPKLRSFLSETSFFAPAEDKCISLVADETEHFYPHQDCLGANRIKTAVLYLTLDWLVIREIKIQFIIG